MQQHMCLLMDAQSNQQTHAQWAWIRHVLAQQHDMLLYIYIVVSKPGAVVWLSMFTAHCLAAMGGLLRGLLRMHALPHLQHVMLWCCTSAAVWPRTITSYSMWLRTSHTLKVCRAPAA